MTKAEAAKSIGDWVYFDRRFSNLPSATGCEDGERVQIIKIVQNYAMLSNGKEHGFFVHLNHLSARPYEEKENESK